MGVEWEDCDVVAKLLGIKTFLNEFVAYADLSTYIKNRQTMNGLRTISVSVAWLSPFYCCGVTVLGPVIQRADNMIQWINRYPAYRIYSNYITVVIHLLC